MMYGEHEMYTKLNPLSGQITYTLVPLMMAVNAALDLFRYRPQADHFDAFEVFSDTNWWKFANLIESYGSLTLGSVAFIM